MPKSVEYLRKLEKETLTRACEPEVVAYAAYYLKGLGKDDLFRSDGVDFYEGAAACATDLGWCWKRPSNNFEVYVPGATYGAVGGSYNTHYNLSLGQAENLLKESGQLISLENLRTFARKALKVPDPGIRGTAPAGTASPIIASRGAVKLYVKPGINDTWDASYDVKDASGYSSASTWRHYPHSESDNNFWYGATWFSADGLYKELSKNPDTPDRAAARAALVQFCNDKSIQLFEASASVPGEPMPTPSKKQQEIAETIKSLLGDGDNPEFEGDGFTLSADSAWCSTDAGWSWELADNKFRVYEVDDVDDSKPLNIIAATKALISSDQNESLQNLQNLS